MTPREMSIQCDWAEQAIECGAMTATQAFSWLCLEWGVDLDEALEDLQLETLDAMDLYALLGYACYPSEAPIKGWDEEWF